MQQKLEGKQKRHYNYLKRLVFLVDLELLGDAVFINILLGMSIEIFAEMNFLALTPLILKDMNLETYQIATIMTIIALSDLVFRILAPYIGEFLGKSSRIMYFISLFFVIITRSGKKLLKIHGNIDDDYLDFDQMSFYFFF